MNIFLRILFIFLSFVFLQGAYNQNISCNNYLSSDFVFSTSQNTTISNSGGEHSEVITTNDKNELSVLSGKNQDIANSNIIPVFDGTESYQDINKYGTYSSERLKSGSAIRAP